MTYGEKIAHLRNSKGITQKELGDFLNVTYQAVSKWERDDALPDFPTISKIAKFFQVPVSYFEDGGEEAVTEPAPAEISEEPAPAPAPAHNYMGVCTVCGKMIEEGEAYQTSPKLICNDCHEREVKAAQEKAEQARREAQRSAERRVRLQIGSRIDAKLIISLVLAAVVYGVFAVLCFTKESFEDRGLMALFLLIVPLAVFAITHAVVELINDVRDRESAYDGYKLSLSLIIGAAFAVVNLALFLALYLTSEVQFYYLPLIFISVICSFAFVSQYLWGSVIRDIFTCGGFTFKIPLVIFRLTPDSIILMLITKVILGLLSVLLFIVTTILFAVIAILGSFFTFIPCFFWKLGKDKKAKNELNQN